MTIVVGIELGGKVYMGADSLGISGLASTERKDSKIFAKRFKAKKNQSSLTIEHWTAIFGFTTSFRMGQVINHCFEMPDYVNESKAFKDVHKYLVSDFIPSLQQALKAANWGKTTDGESTGGTFMIGLFGHLFTIESDFQVGSSFNGFDAIGCGREFALGSLYTARDFNDWTPRDHLIHALEAAEKFSTGCGKPFVIADES